MATFSELNQRLQNAKFRKTILSKLMEYIDENFTASEGTDPKNFLLTDDQVKVPVELFEAVIADTLSPELQQIDAEIASILGAELAPPPPQEAPPAQEKESTP